MVSCAYLYSVSFQKQGHLIDIRPFKRCVVKCLLVIEDSEQFRQMIISMLKGYYEKIYQCTDGKYAKDAYEKYKPDWVVMDVHMKEMDGLTATKQLKAAHPEAHIVLMSQCHDPEMMEEAKSAGAENFILKDNILEIKKIMGLK